MNILKLAIFCLPLVLLNSCSTITHPIKEEIKIWAIENWFDTEYKTLYKIWSGFYINNSLVWTSELKWWWLFDDDYLVNYNNSGSYIINEEWTWVLNNKILNKDGKRIESRFYWFVKNYLSNWVNVAYYKCEKLIYFSNTNSNDCLANQIWVDNKLVDSVDMNFLNDNRKYPFHLKWFDTNELIYQKGDIFYKYTIWLDKSAEFIELNNLKKYYKTDVDKYNSFNFIWYLSWKLAYTIENYWTSYDDTLIDKIKELIKKDWWTIDGEWIKELLGNSVFTRQLKFPSFYWTGEDDSIEMADYDWSNSVYTYIPTIHWLKELTNTNWTTFNDLYLDGKLYDKNIISPQIIWWNFYYLKLKNPRFEVKNPSYFTSPDKTLFQYPDKNEKTYVIYSIYKNNSLLWKVDFKSPLDYWFNGIIKIIDWKSSPCIFNEENFGENLRVCIWNDNYIAQSKTLSSKDKSMVQTVLIYNWIKLNLDKYLISTDDIEQSAKNGLLYTKFQPIINNDWTLWKSFIYGVVTDENFKEVYKLWKLKKTELFDYLVSKTWIKDKSIIERVNDKWTWWLTPDEIIDYEKVIKYMEELTHSIKYNLFSVEYDGNWNFQNPKSVIENINDFYGSIKK